MSKKHKSVDLFSDKKQMQNIFNNYYQILLSDLSEYAGKIYTYFNGKSNNRYVMVSWC